MPGLVAIVTRKPAAQARAELDRMRAAMSHAPYYVTRTFVDEDLGVYAAWTALAGAADDIDVRTNERGETRILCGETFGAHTDADVPANLNGMFHGLVCDSRHERVQIFNDRYGMHRLFVHESSDATYVAAEAKAIPAVCTETRRFDARGLSEWLSLGCVLEDRTLFDGVSVMPGASLWTFERGRLARRDTYFHPREWEAQAPLPADAAYAELRDAFVNALPRYFSPESRVGMSLTGGLDTRIVMASHAALPETLPCYTFAGDVRESRDVTIAREVAKTCGQPFTAIPIGGDFFQRFGDYAERAARLTDGHGDAHLSADVFFNEHARAIAPVRTTGLLGGEVLRRVRAFKHAPPRSGVCAPLETEMARARETYARAIDAHPLTFAAFRQAPWHHQTSLALERGLLTMRTPFLDNALVRALYRAPAAMTTTDDVSLRLIADGNQRLAHIPTDGGPHALSFKADYAFSQQMPSWMNAVERPVRGLRLDRLFLGRHRPTHFRVWYRGQLAGYVRDVLLDPRSLARPHVDRISLQRVVEAHTKGTGDFTGEIHKLLGLELACRAFVDGSNI